MRDSLCVRVHCYCSGAQSHKNTRLQMAVSSLVVGLFLCATGSSHQALTSSLLAKHLKAVHHLRSSVTSHSVSGPRLIYRKPNFDMQDEKREQTPTDKTRRPGGNKKNSPPFPYTCDGGQMRPVVPQSSMEALYTYYLNQRQAMFAMQGQLERFLVVRAMAV